MSNVDLSPQALAQKQQEKELMELAEKFNNLADDFFKAADEAGLNIRQANIFFTKHLPLMWSSKVDKFQGDKKVSVLL